MQQEAKASDVLLVICDISGYTRFMIANHEARQHGSVIITELIQAVLRQTRSPFQVAKLEGDAVFLYASLPGRSQEWGAARRREIHQLFWAFEEKLAELVQSNLCACGGCVNANHLRLKVVIHCGTAVLHRIGKFEELSGLDVILVHRLLKNSVKQDQYMLMTTAAHSLLGLETDTEIQAGVEDYDDLGSINTITVALPKREGASSALLAGRAYASWPYRIKNILRRILQSRWLWLHGKRHLRLAPDTLPDAPALEKTL